MDGAYDLLSSASDFSGSLALLLLLANVSVGFGSRRATCELYVPLNGPEPQPRYAVHRVIPMSDAEAHAIVLRNFGSLTCVAHPDSRLACLMSESVWQTVALQPHRVQTSSSPTIPTTRRARRRRRSLSRPADERDSAVRRREDPDPGPRKEVVRGGRDLRDSLVMVELGGSNPDLMSDAHAAIATGGSSEK